MHKVKATLGAKTRAVLAADDPVRALGALARAPLALSYVSTCAEPSAAISGSTLSRPSK